MHPRAVGAGLPRCNPTGWGASQGAANSFPVTGHLRKQVFAVCNVRLSSPTAPLSLSQLWKEHQQRGCRGPLAPHHPQDAAGPFFNSSILKCGNTALRWPDAW